MAGADRLAAAEQTLAAALERLPPAPKRGLAQFREMVEHSVKGSALLAPDGTILEANSLARQSLGGSTDTVIGTVLWDSPVWSAPDARVRLRASVSACARGVAARHEMAVDGETGAGTLDVSFTPIMSATGDVALIAAEWRDITDRKRAEAALRDSEERFHRIVAIAADAIISIDDQQRIMLFNQGAEKMFGYVESEALGQALDMLLPRELATLHAKEVRGFAAAPDIARRMGDRRQIFGRRKSGEIFSAEASISKATIGGELVFTAVVRDVTERWAAEQEKSDLLAAAQAARTEAEHATRQRDEMLGIVSHDLRNPLSTIGMCASVLADATTEPEERQRLADTMHESIRWTQRLIADLLDIASIEAGGLSINPKAIDPMITIGRALALFELPVAERSIKLQAAGGEHLPQLRADPERVLQVLSNLLGNALKFTPAGGTIAVGAEHKDGAVVFSVRDSGSGISADHLPHVFDRRWQADKGSIHGTGLGLAIARGIVEAHGGRIWVASAPGKGSAFHFSIPLPSDG
jgi:PAS domain S-box-containing protein